MRRIRNIVLKGVCFLLLSALVVFLAFVDFYGVKLASAETVTASDVLDDLHKDESFDESNYPEIAENYSLQLIQIAESTGKELLVYVYQPSGQAKDLKAVSINISTSAVEEINSDNYKLKYCNSSGVFYKYVVDGLTVISDTTRYYAIPSIFRAFIDEIDTPAGYDNTITEIPYAVEKQYCFSEINGNPYCKVIDFETIEVTDKFVGFVRYSDGHNFWGTVWGSCDSHFVAFNTDKRIDRLLEADVYFTKQSYKNGKQTNYVETFGEEITEKIPLNYTQKVEHTGELFGAGTYTWNRIETVEQFISENDLTQNVYSGAIIDVNVANKITEEGKTALEGKKWLLRFVETDYSFSTSGNAASGNWNFDTSSTLVGNVTILRLKFETDGIPYNLGVIDNKQTGNKKPINEENALVSVADSLKNIFMVICVIALFVFLATVCPPIVKVLKFLIKSAVWVISLPFKLLGAIFKRRK